MRVQLVARLARCFSVFRMVSIAFLCSLFVTVLSYASFFACYFAAPSPIPRAVSHRVVAGGPAGRRNHVDLVRAHGDERAGRVQFAARLSERVQVRAAAAFYDHNAMATMLWSHTVAATLLLRCSPLIKHSPKQWHESL
jgi:hypothetical protein